MILSDVEKILNKEPNRHFTITEIVDILILTVPQERNRTVLEARIVNKIIKNKGRLSFSFGEKNGILYLYSRENDKYHRLNRKVPDTPFFNRLKRIKIRMTILYAVLLIMGFSYLYFFKWSLILFIFYIFDLNFLTGFNIVFIWLRISAWVLSHLWCFSATLSCVR